MTEHHTNSGSDEIDSEAAFQEALESLVVAASDSGIDPVGTWDVRNGAGDPDWEIMILELAKENE